MRAKVSYPSTEGWCFIVGSATPKRATSKPPTYAKHRNRNNRNSVQKRCIGSFRHTAGRRHLHRHYNFAELIVDTAVNSLHDSCRSEHTRQETTLPDDRYS